MMFSYFSYANCHPHTFFGEMSIQDFGYFVIGLLIFLLLSFKSALYISSNRCILCIFCIFHIFCIFVLFRVIRCILYKHFFQVCGLSYSLFTLFHRAKVFNFNEVQLINSSLWIMSLVVLFLKSHHCTLGHLGFPWSYFPGVL